MKTFLPLLVAALLLAGCQHPGGHVEAQAAQAAITRTAAAVATADQANARAAVHVEAARTAAQRIDDKAVVLLHSNW